MRAEDGIAPPVTLLTEALPNADNMVGVVELEDGIFKAVAMVQTWC